MPIHDWTRVSAGIFHDFHHEWISTIKRSLNNGVLPKGYYALAEQIAGGLGPDVLTLGTARPPSDGTNGGGIALALHPPKVRFTAASDTDLRTRKRSRIAIRHSSGDEVVTILEIVSPGNKASRHALGGFVAKAAELLDAGIHLLVIDLFPPGPRDPNGMPGAIWDEVGDGSFRLPDAEPLTCASYAAGPTTRAFVEPATVGRPVPEAPLFLEAETYVHLPLEPSYEQAFEAVPERWREILTAESP